MLPRLFKDPECKLVVMKHMVIESCHSTWIFDVEGRRFRRVLKGIEVGAARPMTGWRPYFDLQFVPNSESFVVLLNADGTRLLRSWRHLSTRCDYCDNHRTMDLSVEEIARAS